MGHEEAHFVDLAGPDPLSGEWPQYPAAGGSIHTEKRPIKR